jgi:FtsH-binding integral membrane protein
MTVKTDNTNFSSIVDKKTFIFKVYRLFIYSLLYSALFCYFGIQLDFGFSWWWLVLWIFTLFLCLSIEKNLLALYLWSSSSGFLIAPILSEHINNGQENLIWQTILLTTFIFIGLSAYVYYTKKDFNRWTATLVCFSLLGILAITLSFFWSNKIYEILVSEFCAFMGAIFVIYDTSYILHNHKPGDEVSAALDLHLDFRMIFLRLLDSYRETKDAYGDVSDPTSDVEIDWPDTD